MNREQPLRVAFIGCGNVTVRSHAPVVRDLSFLSPVAVADPAPARRAAALSILGLPQEAGFDTHQEMLSSCSPDYVVLAVPPALRAAIVDDCARHNVHVLSEKPLATIPSVAQGIASAMAHAGLKMGMVHNYLYYPEYMLLKELITSGAVGDVRHVTLNFLGVPDHPGTAEYRPAWRHDPLEAGGGVLMDMIHAVYLAEFLVGSPFQAVSAIVDNLNRDGDVVEDLALVQLYFAGGYASINMSWGHGPGGVELAGSRGRALIFYKDYGTGPFNMLDSFTLVNGDGRQSFQPRRDDAHNRSFFAVHEDFSNAIRRDQAPIATPQDAIRSLEVVLGAYASAVEGRVVDLPLPATHPVYRSGVAGLRHLPAWSGSRLVRRRLFGCGLSGSSA